MSILTPCPKPQKQEKKPYQGLKRSAFKRKPAKKKKKVIKKTTVRNRIDAKWSAKVRAKGACEVCGKTEFLNAHHIIGRTDLRTRWDVRNGVSLCSGHHTMNNESAHENPIWFMGWLEVNRGEDLAYLKEKMKQAPSPYTVQDYLNIEISLTTN